MSKGEKLYGVIILALLLLYTGCSSRGGVTVPEKSNSGISGIAKIVGSDDHSGIDVVANGRTPEGYHVVKRDRTDRNGIWKIDNLPKGDYTLTISKPFETPNDVGGMGSAVRRYTSVTYKISVDKPAVIPEMQIVSNRNSCTPLNSPHI